MEDLEQKITHFYLRITLKQLPHTITFETHIPTLKTAKKKLSLVRRSATWRLMTSHAIKMGATRGDITRLQRRIQPKTQA